MLGIRQARGSGRFDHGKALVVIVCIRIIRVEGGGDRRVAAAARSSAAVGFSEFARVRGGDAERAVVNISSVVVVLSVVVAVAKGLEALRRQGDGLEWLQQQLRWGSVV